MRTKAIWANIGHMKSLFWIGGSEKQSDLIQGNKGAGTPTIMADESKTVRKNIVIKGQPNYLLKGIHTVVAAFLFFVLSTKTKRKRNRIKTETKRKRSLNEFFETRFQFSQNILTFSQWNGETGFRLNAFFFPKTFVQSALTYRKAS